jgi:hypothetical protein
VILLGLEAQPEAAGGREEEAEKMEGEIWGIDKR